MRFPRCGIGARYGASVSTSNASRGACRAASRISSACARFRCCADIGYAAEDTHGNAEEAAQWTQANHFHSLVIVTGRYHMPRTMKEFSAVLPNVSLIAYPVDQSRIDLSGWWRHPRTIGLLHREYVKYLATWMATRLLR